MKTSNLVSQCLCTFLLGVTVCVSPSLIAQDNITLISPDDDVLSGTITIQANLTVTASNFVASGANATYRAGTEITLIDGFEAEEGSDFLAEIGALVPDNAAASTGNGFEAFTNESYDDKLIVFPNPNHGFFDLDIKLEQEDFKGEGEWQVAIHQPGGGIIYAKPLPSAAHFEVNISHAPKGQYVVQLIQGGSVRTSKVMIVQ